MSNPLISIYPCRGYHVELQSDCARPATGKLYSAQGHFIGYHCDECAAELIEHGKKLEARRLPGHEENLMRAQRFERDSAITPERIANLVAALRAEKGRPDLWLAAGLIERAWLGKPEP